MEIRSHQFKSRARAALQDEVLQQALSNVGEGFVAKRAKAIALVPDFEQWRDAAAHIRAHVLDHLADYLERFETQVLAHGGQVHWAANAAEAQTIILAICQEAQAKVVCKGKSMVSEEIALNAALERGGLAVIETDLGEYILQLNGESPSHIIAPALHKTRAQVADLFTTHHPEHSQSHEDVPSLVGEARRVLRDKFFSADVGITGANFLIAETGATVIVTNEGNGDLSQTLAPVHIVTAGIERVIPTMNDVAVMLRVLARSATGQDSECYTTFSLGARRADDLDGPRAFHVVLIDNGRSQMLAGPYRDMLRCIRCGACMNHCPVYQKVGGHAYGWIYPGPMGSVLTPLMAGLSATMDLPNACTLNGRCQSVCPVKIPLADFLRRLRADQFALRLGSPLQRWGLALWRYLSLRPTLYHTVMWVASWLGRPPFVRRLKIGPAGRALPRIESTPFL